MTEPRVLCSHGSPLGYPECPKCLSERLDKEVKDKRKDDFRWILTRWSSQYVGYTFKAYCNNVIHQVNYININTGMIDFGGITNCDCIKDDLESTDEYYILGGPIR